MTLQERHDAVHALSPTQFCQVFFAEGGTVIMVVDTVDEPVQLYAGQLDEGILYQRTTGSRVDGLLRCLSTPNFGEIEIPSNEYANFGWWHRGETDRVKIVQMDPDWFDIDIIGEENEKARITRR